MSKEVKELAASQLGLLEQRLKAADELATSDPEGARKMYRAVVELFAGKPWAADAVRRAREALERKAEPAVATP